MIIRKIFILIFCSVFLNAETVFDVRQQELVSVKNIVQYEESIARAYEEYIINNYEFPTISDLTAIIGNVGISATGIINIPTLTTGLTILSYALDTATFDSGIIELYESNSLRKRTYVRGGKIHFILEDPFARHLYDLLKKTGSAIENCPLLITTAINCKENNHIYIGVKDSLKTDFLMNYHIDKFKTGPIIITKDTSLQRSKDEFNSIPKGAILYDTNGAKYVKTTSSIELLK